MKNLLPFINLRTYFLIYMLANSTLFFNHGSLLSANPIAINISPRPSLSSVHPLICPSLDSVVCVPAYIGHCGESSDPSHTGWPNVNGTPIAPNYDCLHATYTDNNSSSCGNSGNINRHWVIKNTLTNQFITCNQFISLQDDQAPSISCPQNFQTPCDKADPEYIPHPQVFDACGSNYSLSLSGPPILPSCIPFSSYTMFWTVTDDCDNSASCAFVITLLCRPTIPANHISFSDVTTNSMTLQWYNGDGNRRIVVMNTTNNFIPPVDNYDPIANTIYIGGSQVVYNGDDENALLTVTGLSANTIYWFRVYEAQECSGAIQYLLSPATGNPKSQSTNGGCVPITITLHPTPQFPDIPNSVTFSVTVTGTSPVYQWQFLAPLAIDWVNLTNNNNTTWTTAGNNSILTIHNTTGLNNYDYHCIVTNGCSVPQISGPGEILASVSSYSVSTKTPYTITPFSNPFTLGSGSINTPAPIIKICSDGSKATIVKYTNHNAAINSSNIRFWVESDPSGTNSDISGYFIQTDYQLNGNTVTCRFTHPKYLSSAFLPYRSDNIRVVDFTNPSTNLYLIPIQIYRAPVMFVHGFYGDANTFAPMASYLQTNNYYTSPLLNIINYHSTSLEAFAANVDEIPNGLFYSYYKTLSGHYSCGKIDIISHSMGGILSRLYIQNDYGFQYKGEVDKLITINTPHSGAYIANAAFLVKILPASLFCGISNLFNINSFICNGAGIDMLTYSYATDMVLNNPLTMGINPVPSHSITTDFSNLTLSLYAGPPFMFVCPTLIPTFLLYLNGEPSDGVVSHNSQDGGLHGTNTSNPTAHFHIGSSAQPNVILKAVDLLCSSPTSGNFSLDGFHPINLFTKPSQSKDFNHNISEPRNLSLNPFLNIIHPTNIDAITSGQSISLEIITDESIKRLIILAGNSSIGVSYFDTLISTEISDFIHYIPLEAIGKYEIDAIGLDSLNNFVVADSVTFNVTTQATIDSITFNPRVILVPSSLQTQFQLLGYFSDNVTRDISSIPEVSYIITNSDIAKIVHSNLLEGILVDSTNLTASVNGLKDSIPIFVYEGDSLRHALFASNRNIICENDQVMLSNLSTGNPQNIYWSFPGGEPSFSYADSPLISYFIPGTYDVTLIANYSNRIDTLTLKGFITVNSLPPANISVLGSTSICKGQFVELSAETNLGNNILWSNDSTSQSITVTDSGFYYIRVIDSLGCRNSSEVINISLLSNPIAEIAGSNSFCPENSTILDAGSGYNSYLWSTLETSQKIIVSDPGGYSVEVIDSNGCSGYSDTLTVTVFDSNPANITASDSTIFCAGDSVFLVANEGTGYNWNTGEITPSIIVKTAGKYVVTVIDSNGCSSISDSVSVLVHDLPMVDLGPDTLTSSIPIVLDAGNPGSAYIWNGVANNQTITAGSTGWYIVLVTDANGCQGSDSVYVNLVTSTIILNESNQIRIFPNPNTGSFTLSGKLASSELLQIKILNTYGQIVFTSKPENVSGKFLKTITIDGAVPGLYFVVVDLGSLSYSGKVLVQRY